MMENTLEQANEQQSEAVEHDVDEGGDDRAQVEQRARDLGWASQDRWRGDPEAWKDAPEFLEVGEHLLSVSRGNVQRLEERLESERRERAQEAESWQQRFERLERMNNIAMDRQREQIVAQFESRKRQAAEVGDMDEYERAHTQQQEQLQDLEAQTKEAAPKEPEKPQNGVSAADQRTFDEWSAQNRWYSEDMRLKGLAEGIFNEVEGEMPYASFGDKLTEVTARIKEAMPDKFGARRSAANAVEPGSRMTSPSKSGKMWSKLPPEAKDAGEKFIKQGLFKDQESYAKDYFAQDD